MSRYVAILVMVSTFLVGQIAEGQWIQWTVAEGGNDHWYRLSIVEDDWEDAEAEGTAVGGYLATVNNATENQWIFDNLCGSGETLWIGLYQLPGSTEPDEGWVWANGETHTYRNWGSGEPNEFQEAGEDKCEFACGANGVWNDRNNDFAEPHRGVLEHVSCPPGVWCQWTVAEGGNDHWYRLTAPDFTWNLAEAEAVAAGGHLVTINDDSEQLWLNGQFPQVPEGSGPPFWIGLYQDHDDPEFSEPAGGWKWISGQPKTYTNWHSSEPNELSGNQEDFARMHHFAPGFWNDINKSVVNAGIIEAVDCNENGILDGCDLDCGELLGPCDVEGCGQSSDSDGDGVPDECDNCPGFDDALPCPIPGVSTWGLIVLAMLVLAAGTLIMTRRKPMVV